MASSSITPYKTNAATQAFALQSTSASGATFIVTGRSLANPHFIQITRKIGPSNSMANDHVIVRISLTDPNATTLKPVTGSVTLDISIPRDNATVTLAEMTEELGLLASLLNDNTALAATTVNRSALLNGQDL